jgi:hypothetical protein
VKATIDGVVRAPSAFSITLASAVHDGDAGVGRAEVDTDNFCHAFAPGGKHLMLFSINPAVVKSGSWA